MEEASSDTDYRDASILEIAEVFEIPESTAGSWKRRIGTIEVLQQTFGRNAPDGYLELVQRREWIPYEQEELENNWVQPVKHWCVERAGNIQLIHGLENTKKPDKHIRRQMMGLGNDWWAVEYFSINPEKPGLPHGGGLNYSPEMRDLKEELEAKEEQVKYELKRFDTEWISLARELHQVEKNLIQIYRSHLSQIPREFSYKKDELIELKQTFPYLRANDDLVAKAVDCSISYATQFQGVSDGEVSNREIPPTLRNSVFERDDDRCVSCGGEEDLVVHHIEPHGQGGENSVDNLAVLCGDCHYFAHGGGHPRGSGSQSTANWSEVEYEDQEEFWRLWIHRDFDRRLSR